MSIESVCVVDNRIIFVIEGRISLKIIPIDKMIPDVKMVKARLSPRKSSFLKKNHFKILYEKNMMTTEIIIDNIISISDKVKS